VQNRLVDYIVKNRALVISIDKIGRVMWFSIFLLADFIGQIVNTKNYQFNDIALIQSNFVG